MERIQSARRGPFLFLVAVALILAIAVFRLPEEFVAGLRRDRPLDAVASGWVYRLLAIAAFLQAAFVGLVLLRPERIRADHQDDPRPEGKIARGAAGMASLTLAYGLGAFLLTGERAGMWLFLVIFAGQTAWYYRQVGQA
jgi:hypothetical protein